MSAKILEAFAEEPQQLDKQFEKEIGCMAGMLQIFDRQNALTGRRFGHRWLSGGRSVPASSCGSPRFDGSASANFTSFTEDRSSSDSQKQFQSLAGSSDTAEPSKGHSIPKETPRRLTDLKVKPGRASVGLTESPRLSFHFKDLPPSSTEAAKDTPRHSIDGLTAKEKAKLFHSASGKDQPRVSYDSREQGCPSDIRDVVRASFNRDPARASVDALERLTLDDRPSLSRLDTGRLSGGGREPPRPSFERREAPRNLIPRSNKEPPRASLDGRDISRSSMDLRAPNSKYSKDAGRRSLDTPRSSLELREPPSPRFSVSRDGHRYSLDGRDAPRYSLDSRDSMAWAQQRVREAPRLSADGRDAPRHSVDPRDMLLANLQMRETASGLSQSRSLSRTSFDSRSSRASSDSLGIRDRDLQPVFRMPARDVQKGPTDTRKSLKSSPEANTKEAQSNVDAKRRVSNVVARLMGLEELPDPALLKPPEVAPPTPPTPRKPSTEAKVLQELLQYKPLDEPQTKLVVDREQYTQINRQSKLHDNEPDCLFFAPKNSAPRKVVDAKAGQAVKQGPEGRQLLLLYRHEDFRAESFQQSKRAPEMGLSGGKSYDNACAQVKPPPSTFRNSTEPMPPAPKQQEAEEKSQTKYSQVKQTQFPEATITVLKHSDQVKQQQQSSKSLLGELEKGLQLLRVKDSQQGRRSLRQVLEAMQLKGLLHPPRTESERHSEAHQSKVSGLSHQNSYGGYSYKRDSHYRGDQSPRVKAIQDMRAYQEMRALDNTMIEVSIDEGKAIPQYGKQASIVLMKPVTRQQQGIKQKAVETMPMAGQSARGVGRVRKVSGVVTRTVKGRHGLAPMGTAREPMSKFNSEEAMSFRRRRENQPKDMNPVSATAETRKALRTLKPPVSALPPKGKTSPAKEPALSKQQSANSKSTITSKAVESGRKQRVSSPQAQMRESEAADRMSADGEPKKVLRRCSSDVADMGSQSVPSEPPCKAPLRVSRKSNDRGRMSRSLSDSEARRRAGPVSKDVTAEQVVTLPSCQQPGVLAEAKPANYDRIFSGSELSQKSSAHSNSEPGNSGDVVRPSLDEANDHSFDMLPLQHLASTLPYPEVSIDKFEQEPHQASSSLLGGSFPNFKIVLLNQEDVKYLGEGITDGAEQPSPVSVLDAPFPDEDHSPRAVNNSIVSLKDAQLASRLEALANEFAWEEELEELEVPSPAPCNVVSADTGTEPLLAAGKAASTEDMHLFRSKAEEKAYVTDILTSSGFTDEKKMVLAWHSPSYPMDPELFDRSEEKRRRLIGSVGDKTSSSFEVDEISRFESPRRSEQEVMDRRLLFDTVNELTARKLRPYLHSQPWISQAPMLLRKPPTGNLLVEEVWTELQELPCTPTEDDVCDTLYSMLQKDLGHKGDKWLDYSTEIGEVGLELERMILKQLIVEAVTDCSSFSSRRTSWARRPAAYAYRGKSVEEIV